MIIGVSGFGQVYGRKVEDRLYWSLLIIVGMHVIYIYVSYGFIWLITSVVFSSDSLS